MVPARPIADDWRQPDTYYRWACSLPNLGWAWEFLRRNPDYQVESSGAPLLDPANGMLAIATSRYGAASAASWGLICFRGFASRCETCHRLLAIGSLSVGPSCHRVTAGCSKLCRTVTACWT